LDRPAGLSAICNFTHRVRHYAQAGQLEEARYEVAEVLRINPGFTIESLKRFTVYKDPKDAEHRIDGLRKTGLPEG
jgi:hypothetical protein